MIFSFLNFYIFCGLFLWGNSQIISQLTMLSSGSLLQTGRDGFLLVTLSTGESTSICNYKFTEVDANVACLTLGYPAQGLSLVNPNGVISGPVLLGDMACTGSETNINSCQNSGKKTFTAPCSSHTMDTYLYCLLPKTAPVIVPNVVTTTCNTSNGNYVFKPLQNKKNTGSILYESKYICNDDYSVTPNDVNRLCQMFCSDVINPLPIMYSSDANLNSNFVKLNNPSVTGCFNPSYALVLQCGPEPTVIENTPNVTCTTNNITATWKAGFIPYINSSLITTPMPCKMGSNTSSIYDAMATFSFQECTPIVTADSTNIYYTYWITRAYFPDGITSLSSKNLTISCSFPKANEKNGSIAFQRPNIPPLHAFADIKTVMIFYNDASFQTLMPAPYTILDTQLMYVKVHLDTQISTLRLGLVNCKVATVNSMAATNSQNSLTLITDSCPATNVFIYPLNRKEMGFQFQPMKISNNNQIYVLCETTKCYMKNNEDSNCLYCKQTSRKKRSAITTDEVVLGPLFVFN